MFRRSIVAFVVVMSLMLVSCKKPGNNFSSRISFINASTGLGTCSVKLNEDTAVTGLDYGTLVPFRNVPSGTFQVNVFTSLNTAPATLLTSLESNSGYTFMLYDSVARPKFFFQKDYLPGSITSGKCAVRFFSLVPGSAGVSILNDTNKIFLSGQNFNSYSNSFEEIDTTSRPVKVTMSGYASLLDSVRLPLVAGKKYTIFLMGNLGGAGIYKTRMLFLEHP